MRPLTIIALILVGLTGLKQLALGALFWTGHSLTLIPLNQAHVSVSSIVTARRWWHLLTLIARHRGGGETGGRPPSAAACACGSSGHVGPIVCATMLVRG
jgi:hypothetical protein